MKKAELIFVPFPAMGHLVSMVELAKLLLTRCEHLAITVLVMKFHTDTGVNSYTESLSRNPITQLSLVEVPPSKSNAYMSEPANKVLTSFIESQVENVKDIVLAMAHCNSTRLAGFVIDLFCVSMIDIANEFEIPIYVFLASGAGLLGLMFHFQTLADDQNEDITEKYKDSDAELSVPSFAKPVPAKVLPSMLLDKDGGSALLLSCARKFRQIKGIIVNTFMELETYALESLAADRNIPPVYPVGPILNLTGAGHNSVETAVILNWLDEQPLSSVVFLCFGSFGSFPDDQVKEIAIALERSGHRFMWSLRPSVAKGDTKFPLGFSKLDDVLPVGFLERTAAIGKVIGWAPQVAVLSHSSVGAFVSHCGWNSTLESVWFGVPVATWPMYAEQQLNAFEMVAELGMAVDISMDYRKDFIVKNDVIVGAEDIEKKIREVMKDENESEVRRKVQEMKGKSRLAMSEKGSSYTWLGQLIKKLV